MPGANGRGGPIVYFNARIVDPASGTDIKGALVTEGGTIRDFGPALFTDALPFDCERIDCGGKVLAPGLVALKANLGCFFHTPPDCHERSIFQFDFQEEDKVLEYFYVLEEKEFLVALGKKAEVKQSPKRGLAEVVSVLVSVLRQANFGHDNV